MSAQVLHGLGRLGSPHERDDSSRRFLPSLPRMRSGSSNRCVEEVGQARETLENRGKTSGTALAFVGGRKTELGFDRQDLRAGFRRSNAVRTSEKPTHVKHGGGPGGEAPRARHPVHRPVPHPPSSASPPAQGGVHASEIRDRSAGAVGLLPPHLAGARDRDLGLGLILGEPTGVSGKLWLSRTTAMDGAVAWSTTRDDELHLQGDFVWHDFELLGVDRGALPLYYGIGGRVRLHRERPSGCPLPRRARLHLRGEPVRRLHGGGPHSRPGSQDRCGDRRRDRGSLLLPIGGECGEAGRSAPLGFAQNPGA